MANTTTKSWSTIVAELRPKQEDEDAEVAYRFSNGVKKKQVGNPYERTDD